MTKIPCFLMRGGTSKGAYFLAQDLPQDERARDALLLAIMGSPDARQIDGIGGANPLTSKVAIVSLSSDANCDIDFLFAQVGVTKASVDTTPNCGNILAAVLPFALERGLLKAQNGRTTAKVRTLNTGTIAEICVETPHGKVNYKGQAKIDGVPKTAAPITINFLDSEGSVCGKLLPTGNLRDTVNGLEVTLIDNGMPVLIAKAHDFSLTGHESPADLDKNLPLKTRLEALRVACGPLMNLGDVTHKVIPKIALVSPPQNGGHINTRSFIPHECHSSIGVFAAVSVATAACLNGSVAHKYANVPEGENKIMSVEHPTGEFSLTLTVQNEKVVKSGLLRTARALFDGVVYPYE
jgi:4-oxalomesaconate tautomerase